MSRAGATSAPPVGGGIVAVVPSGAVTSIAIPERSHPAGHDTRTGRTNSAPTATSAGSLTSMTIAWVTAGAVIGAARTRRCGAPSCGAFGGVAAGDAAEHQAPGESVLGEAALRFT